MVASIVSWSIIKWLTMKLIHTHAHMHTHPHTYTHTHTHTQDTPGFIVNRLLVPYMAEAVRLLEI